MSLLARYWCLFILISVVFSCSPTEKNIENLIQKRKKRIELVLKEQVPVLFLHGNKWLTEEQQRSLLRGDQFKAFFFENVSGRPFLNEVLSISELRPSDIHNEIKACKTRDCLRMEIYNYAHNGTLIVTVDKSRMEAVHKVYYPQMQGDLNEELADLAIHIAIMDTLVQEAYGDELRKEDGVMQGTKTSLNRTKCQRSGHLCAAPTFVKGDKALWAIVDLADLQVAGVEWTDVGRTGMPVTQRSAQNDRVMLELCDRENVYHRDDWKFKYNMTRSDGMKVYDVEFRDQQLIKSIKTVDWHVSYSDRKGFGYSDAIGCPEFSMAAVIAVELPSFVPLIEGKDTIGFKMTQDYYSKDWPMPCAYNYRQEFEFFRDGSFRPKIASIGRGCGTDGTYRPVTRVALNAENQSFYVAQDTGWIHWKEEQWFREDELFPYRDDVYLAKWVQGDKAFWIESNQGQFGDGSRGDKAFFYVTVDHPDKIEGEGDLPTIGPCCNTDHRQGPEKFINEESLENEELVFWYVPELKNDGRKGKEYCWAESVLVNGKYEAKIYPCFSGPKFNYQRKVQ